MRCPIRDLSRNARGATAIEYGLIVALIALAVVSGISLLGGESLSLMDGVSNRVTSAMKG